MWHVEVLGFAVTGKCADGETDERRFGSYFSDASWILVVVMVSISLYGTLYTGVALMMLMAQFQKRRIH